MNTGIGDAVNLSWKLAAVLEDGADPAILDTYEEERIGFARSLVATTDRLFQMMVVSGASGELFRENLFPHIAPFLLGFSPLREAAFRLISQTRINYRDSSLSEGHAGHVRGGDRLPWVKLGDGWDNFEMLKTLDWQIHIYGTAEQAIREAARDYDLPIHEFDWTNCMGEAGMKRDALYLVRPDGYVALADAAQSREKLIGYLESFKVLASSSVSV